jgi:hypothetical protein
MLIWLRARGCPWHASTAQAAASAGCVPILEWMLAHKPPPATLEATTCTAAARHGQMEALRWLRAHGCAWSSATSLGAAASGHLECLRWLVDGGCAVSLQACLAAAKAGHTHVLQYAQANNLPWDRERVASACRLAQLNAWLGVEEPTGDCVNEAALNQVGAL